jgi:hypothetical protein
VSFVKGGKKRKRWLAQIVKDGRQHYVGLFLTKEEAHMAYQQAAWDLHGQFAASLNGRKG